MTVSATNAYSGPYTGNGSTTDFPFTFFAETASEVQVLVNGIPASGYTVSLTMSGNKPSGGGTASFAVAPASGATILVVSNPSFAQEISFEDAGAFQPSTHDIALDRAASRDIWLRDNVNRALKAPVGESLSALPAATVRANKFLGFDADGNFAALSGTSGDNALRADLGSNTGGGLIGFIRNGTGAIARTIRNILLSAVAPTPEDFGAVGDGVANDTAALAAWLACGSKWLYWQGAYATTGNVLNQVSGLRLCGPATLKFNGSPVNGTHALALIQCSDVVIDGLTVDGQNQTRGVVAGSNNLSAYGCDRITFRNVKSLNSAGDGLYINRAATGSVINGVTMGAAISSNITTDRCLFDMAGRNDLTIVACEGFIDLGSTFSNAGMSSAGGLAPSAGVDLEPNDTVQYFPKRCSFIGSRFIGNSGGHLLINGYSRDTLVEGFHMEGGASYGISVAGERTTIRNGGFKNVGGISRPAILLQSQDGRPRATMTVDNITVEGAIFGGITVNDYADAFIGRAVVRDGANFALRVAGDADHGDGNKGYCVVDDFRGERLYASSAPSGSAYIFVTTNYGGALTLRRVRLLRTGATGTPIENGMLLTGATDVQEVSDFNAVGTFATAATAGFALAKTLRNNRINGTIDTTVGGYTAATQATSKATAVVCNARTGQVTMNNASLAANTVVSFTLTNSFIPADARVFAWIKSGNASAGSYRVQVEGNAAGSRTIVVENKTAGPLSEALVIGFEVVPMVTA